jgi:hypothetical protein
VTAKWPTALVVVIALCLLRGLVGLWHIATLFRYFLQGRYPAFGMFYVYLTETVLFLIFGLWLLRRSPAARLATISLCGFGIFWSSYSFLSQHFHRMITTTTMVYFFVYLASDLVTIACLSLPSIKTVLEVEPRTSATLPPAV